LEGFSTDYDAQSFKGVSGEHHFVIGHLSFWHLKEAIPSPDFVEPGHWNQYERKDAQDIYAFLMNDK